LPLPPTLTPPYPQELVDLLDLDTDVNILKVAIDGLQNAIKRGQMVSTCVLLGGVRLT